jgi:Family of unknown function (DUF5681)
MVVGLAAPGLGLELALPKQGSTIARRADSESRRPERLWIQEPGENQMTFEKGQSGKPAGRPPGSRNQATILAEAMFQGEAEAISRMAIDAASVQWRTAQGRQAL